MTSAVIALAESESSELSLPFYRQFKRGLYQTIAQIAMQLNRLAVGQRAGCSLGTSDSLAHQGLAKVYVAELHFLFLSIAVDLLHLL